MPVVRLTVTPDADGVLRFAIPAEDGEAGGVEAAVVVAPVDRTLSATAPEELGRPPQPGEPGAPSSSKS